jgi:phage terminase large subunit GpA-like protein
VKTLARALPIIAGVFAAAFVPPAPLPPSAWAAEHFVLPDGERKGFPIDLGKTPHLIEPIDALGPDSPDNEVAVMKSAQSAFTTALQIVVCHSIDRDPCDMMVVQPTDSALTDFNSQKLGRALELSPVMRLKVRPQTSRSGTASTTYEKKFSPDCSLFLALATSTADLRSKTVKKALCDEIDEYQDDLNGQGDPLDMIEARQISFLRSGNWKRGYFSTPTIKGASKIEAKYEAGDQRRWTMTCPHCGDRGLVFEWGKNFHFNKAYPYNAHYVPPCCGAVIEGWRKFDVYLTGRWVATAPGDGKFKSYHFDALASPFVPWDDIAKKFCDAGDNPNKLKTFWNLTLGLPYEMKGDAPDHVRLLERREDYPQGRRGLLLSGGADVQHSGIWFEIVAAAANGETWSVDHGFLEGDTTDHKSGAFAQLAEIYERSYADAFGASRVADAFAVDAGDGGRANQVYQWCRLRPRAFAIKGVAGWTSPAIGTPSRVDIKQGKRKVIKGGATVWPVGTWSLKATFYTNLTKEGAKAGAERDPDGYCHHHMGCDERYFRQMTAEYLATTRVRGRTVKVWQESGPNHLLDCRIYAMAMLEYLGLSRMNADQWSALARMRGVPIDLQQPDLLAPEPVQIAARPPLLGVAKRKRGRRMLSRGIS